jgi:hypothetical protein
MNGLEWLGSYEERLQEIRARTTRAHEKLAGVTGTATSRDGAVVATVDSAGALQDLVLTEYADTLTREQLAAAVLATTRRARQEAAGQAEAALVPVFGEGSAAMALLRAHLTVAER